MKAVSIMSGGLDSTCMTAYLIEKGYEIYALTFHYGQKASTEVDRAKELAELLGAQKHEVIDISFMKQLYVGSNVLTGKGEVPSNFDYSIVVPIRNAIFLTIASAYAFSIKADVVSYGAHKDDEKYYPDTRVEFAKSLENTLNLGEKDGIEMKIRKPIRIISPGILNMTKSDLLKEGYRILGNIIYKTWSCYKGGNVQCGECRSCNNRKRTFKEAGIPDLTPYINP